MGLVLFLHFVLEEKTWIESTTSRNRCDVRLHCLLLTIYYFFLVQHLILCMGRTFSHFFFLFFF